MVNLGIWTPGVQIPSEQDLYKLYGVSRTVFRQALRELELERVVDRRLRSFNEEPIQMVTTYI